jgi:hypothetical protein
MFRSLYDRLFQTAFNFGTNGNGTGTDPYKWFAGARIYDDLAVSKGGIPVAVHASINDDRGTISPPSLERPLNATGRDIDRLYKELANAGVKILLCPQGAFANQDLPDTVKANSYRKHPAIDQSADPNKVESYEPYAHLFAEMVLRWGPDKRDELEEVYTVPGNSWMSTDPGTGRNTVWAFQGGNEDNFKWHGGRVLTVYQSGIKWAITYVFARNYSPNAKLVAPSFLAATADKMRDFCRGFIDGLQQLGYDHLDSANWNWHPSFHRYHREGNQGQTQVNGDKGASPESVDAYELYRAIVEVCNEYGTLAPMLTETGYNDDPRPSAEKQRAPIQEGLDLFQSRAVMDIRNLILAACAGVDTVCAYHIADDFGGDGSWEDLIGWFHGKEGNHPFDPGKPYYAPKPSVQFLKQWMDEVGRKVDVPKQKPLTFRFDDGRIVVTVEAVDSEGKKHSLQWLDHPAGLIHNGESTPIPTLDLDEAPEVPEGPETPEFPYTITPSMEKLAENEFGTLWWEKKRDVPT